MFVQKLKPKYIEHNTNKEKTPTNLRQSQNLDPYEQHAHEKP